MCESMNVSRAGFYKFLKCEPSVRSQENKVLVEEITNVYKESRKNYGSPRVYEELVARGFEVNKKRVARLMAEEGIVGRRKGRFKKTTDSNHDDPIAPNLLNREFEVEKPDVAWVADVTYIWTVEGWLYLAVIVDLFSRKVVGWSIADHMRTELVLDALKAALGSRVPDTEGLLFHSDRGSQYAAGDYRNALELANITASMSRRANCWDNAVAESFFSSLKTELVHNMIFLNKESAKTAIAEWIEIFYNRKRRHSSIGYKSPVDYERHYDESVNINRAA
jgi:putative transposase